MAVRLTNYWTETPDKERCLYPYLCCLLATSFAAELDWRSNTIERGMACPACV